MPLKLKKSETPSEPSPVNNELSGPWGRINPDSRAGIALRLCMKTSSNSEETHSYPYRVLSSWHWRGSSEGEELKIEAGRDLVTVKGRRLDRLVEALENNTLEILRETPENSTIDTETSISVSAISIANMTNS